MQKAKKHDNDNIKRRQSFNKSINKTVIKKLSPE